MPLGSPRPFQWTVFWKLPVRTKDQRGYNGHMTMLQRVKERNRSLLLEGWGDLRPSFTGLVLFQGQERCFPGCSPQLWRVWFHRH